MLCSLPPLFLSVNSIINNVKTCRFDKYFTFDRPHKELYYLNSFIKQLELSSSAAAILNEHLKPDNWYRNLSVGVKICRNDTNLIFKRSFHSKASSHKVDEEIKNLNVKISDIKMSETMKDLLDKFNLKPHIQRELVKAYQLGCDRVVNSSPDSKKRFSYFLNFFRGAIVLLILIYLAKVSVNGSFSNYLSRLLGDSGATLVNKVDVKFDDVQGCDEVKKDLQDVVSFLKNPSTFNEIGAKLPKGVLLCGEPGIGKTLLARAVAGEAGVPFLFISGSQFDEMFVGVGASRVRALFNEAKSHSPCVVFIDELDAVCGHRTSAMGHPHANQTINQLLSEMDGFMENEGIIVVGATNRIEAIDKAALRPGRFDLKVQVYPPDFRGRIALFNLYLSKILTDGNVDVQNLAKSTIGYTGADIKNMVNQAAIICVLKGDHSVTMGHLWESQTKVTLGSARSRPTQEKDNILTAYHEAGHSIVKYFTPNSPDKVKVVTIIPRGHSGGHNSFIPKEESNYQSKAQLMAIIDAAMGGRAAEELLNGVENISTGVSSDMKYATKLARRMVQTFSMSDEVGLQVFEDKNCSCGSLSSSPKMAEIIDAEVNRILKESYLRAKFIIQEHQKEWHLLSKALLKYETLEGDDIELVINGKKPKIAIITEELLEKKQNSSIAKTISRFFEIYSSKDTKE